jgi:hypothetical protein
MMDFLGLPRAFFEVHLLEQWHCSAGDFLQEEGLKQIVPPFQGCMDLH